MEKRGHKLSCSLPSHLRKLQTDIDKLHPQGRPRLFLAPTFLLSNKESGTGAAPGTSGGDLAGERPHPALRSFSTPLGLEGCDLEGTT